MDLDGLKQLIESKLSALNQRFDGQDRTLGRIETQTTRTNGRADRLEVAMAAALERLNGHDLELRDMKRDRDGREDVTSALDAAVEKLTKALPSDLHGGIRFETETGENRGVTQRDVWLFLGSVGLAVAVMKALGLLHFAVTP